MFYRLIRMAADKNAFMEKLLKERQADFDKKQQDYTKLMDEARATRLEVRYFVKVILFMYEFAKNIKKSSLPNWELHKILQSIGNFEQH